jgi:hypothetical protein
VIPETVGALVAFLGLIAPGLVFQLRRESRQAALKETPFREASHVALWSFGLSSAAFGALALLRWIKPGWMPDAGEWLRSGNVYFVDHYRLVIRAAVIHVGVACSLAVLLDHLIRKMRPGQGTVSKTSVWFQVLRADRPAGTVPWVHIRLKDQGDFWGYVGYYSAEQAQEDRELSIIGPHLSFRAPGTTDVVEYSADEWASVVVPAREIAYLKVEYRPAA